MTADPIFFRDLAYVFLAALIGGGLARLARQPLILGYVLGGILISPLTPGPALTEVRTFALFAEIGVILLMFSVGIEFSLRDLLRVKWVALGGGPLGILLSVALGLAVGGALGWPARQGLVIGIVVSVASTMVMARLLLDRGELHSRHGRVMVGITLVEDLAVVVLLVLMPELGALDADRLTAIAMALGRAALVLIPFAFLAARVVPRLMTRVARLHSQELFLLVALAIGLGTAALAQALGLSLALGAFLAGLIISDSDYAHETLAQLLSLRDAFVALFFVTIGALIDPRLLFANLELLGVMVGLIVIGKLVLWVGVVRLFGYPFWTALLVGIGLTQIGEFSFILVQAARAAGHVGPDFYNATLAASLFTILINAALVRLVPTWIGGARLARQRPAAAPSPGATASAAHTVLCGFGRVGSAVGEALGTFGAPYIVIEVDPDVVRGLRARGVPCLFGDASHRTLLEAAGVERATLVVLAIPGIERARLAVARSRQLNPTVPILARAQNRADHETLRAAGATEVVQPELEAAAALVGHALRRLVRPAEQTAYLERFREAMDATRRQGPTAPEGLPEIREVTLGPGRIAGQSLREAQIRERFGITVVAVARDGGAVVLNPAPETVLRAGDHVRLFGLPAQIDAFLAQATASGYPEET